MTDDSRSDSTFTISVGDVEFVKELYPRLREDDDAIERYRVALDRLPPIVVARGRVLVDGFHRWQAHRREGVESLQAVDLGNLTDVEILKQSLVRNAAHGVQLTKQDKKRNADLLYRGGTTDYDEIADLLSLESSTAREYCRDARRDETADQKAKAWELWLECQSDSAIADELGVGRKTVSDWAMAEIQRIGDSPLAPESRQHFDVWQFPPARDDTAGSNSYFGRIPPQVIENLLWFYTDPGDVVFDPFAGGGTTIDVAKRMGRRVWASDLEPSTPTLPIRKHNILDGWPDDYPGGRFPKPNLVILDPPYWKQAAGKYPKHTDQLGDMDSLDDFYDAWRKVIETIQPKLAEGGHVAFIISPTQLEDGTVVDHAFDMAMICRGAGLKIDRRIVVPYSTQQATGQQVEWARDKKRMLKLYRDLVVLS
jgi:hypothetical protein